MELYKDPDQVFSREELEAMTTEQLDDILRESMYISDASEGYIDYILLVLDVIEKREGKQPSPALDAAWEEIKRKYLKGYSDGSENS